jgi:hypothetical protein
MNFGLQSLRTASSRLALRTRRTSRYASLTVLVFPGIASVLVVLLARSPAHAALPELRITPLRYDQHLELGRPGTGVIDASNPTGSTIHVAFQVQAFRQINDRGELEYYDDERIAAAITPAIPEFDLGPREAIRTRFTIDPGKLGPGGAYAVIFLRTIDPDTSPGQVNTSARVGTLLILDVGPGGTKSGRITSLVAPRFVYGRPNLTANVTYANTGDTQQSLAFAPRLTSTLGWYGRPQPHAGPFVFPGRSRSGSVVIATGNHAGLMPLTLRDTVGGSRPATHWAFVVTGFWAWLLPLILLAIILGLTPAKWWTKKSLQLAEKPQPKPAQISPSPRTNTLDGLAARPPAQRSAIRRFLKRFLRLK